MDIVDFLQVKPTARKIVHRRPVTFVFIHFFRSTMSEEEHGHGREVQWEDMESIREQGAYTQIFAATAGMGLVGAFVGDFVGAHE